MGRVGEGTKAPLAIETPKEDEFSYTVLKDAINSLIEHKIGFIDLRWYGAFLVINLPGKETPPPFTRCLPSFPLGFSMAMLAIKMRLDVVLGPGNNS